MRSNCSVSCNLRGAGLGMWATASTALPNWVDAYFWLKSPAESDGCACGPECASGNAACAADDALGSRAGEPPPPPAGFLYASLLLRLAARAHLQAQDETVLGLRGSALTFGGPPRMLWSPPPAPPPAPPPPRCVACGSVAGNALSVLMVLLLSGALGLWLARTQYRSGGRGRRHHVKAPTAAREAGAMAMLVGSHQPQRAEEEEDDDDGEKQDGVDGAGGGEGEGEDTEDGHMHNHV